MFQNFSLKVYTIYQNVNFQYANKPLGKPCYTSMYSRKKGKSVYIWDQCFKHKAYSGPVSAYFLSSETLSNKVGFVNNGLELDSSLCTLKVLFCFVFALKNMGSR
jgi:hypothetical protein